MGNSSLFNVLSDAAHSKHLLEEIHRKHGLSFSIYLVCVNVEPVFVVMGRMSAFTASRMVPLSECDVVQPGINPLVNAMEALHTKLQAAWDRSLDIANHQQTAIV